MTVSTSPDITTFDFAVVWDLSALNPVVTIINKSVGPHLNLCSYWFEVITGGGMTFHKGTSAAPDKTAAWTSFIVSEAMPMTLGHLQWSGPNFVVIGTVKDSANNVFTQNNNTFICRPGGNVVGQADNFGKALLKVESKCDIAKLYVEDLTSYTYNGLAGSMVSNVCRLFYPLDATGVLPDKKEVSNVNNILFPLGQSGEGYQLHFESIYRYDYSATSSVIFKYKFKQTFAIRCNIDLCPLIADVQRLEQDYEERGCTVEERDKLTLINSKLIRVLAAKMQPLCGVDISALVDEIKQLGGFTCDCNSYTTGINPLQPTANNSDCSQANDCLNSILNNLDYYTMAPSLSSWQGMSLQNKLQAIVTKANS